MLRRPYAAGVTATKLAKRVPRPIRIEREKRTIGSGARQAIGADYHRDRRVGRQGRLRDDLLQVGVRIGAGAVIAGGAAREELKGYRGPRLARLRDAFVGCRQLVVRNGPD